MTALIRGRIARSQLPASPLVLAGGRQHTPETLLKAWHQSKSPHTIAAYQTSANETVLHFKVRLERSGMAPSSINRHLAALRSLTSLGRMLGALTWQIEVSGVRIERRRDTRGPEPATVRAVLDAIDVTDPAGARDAAIIHVLFGLALRAAELCRLDVADLDVARGTLWVLGKGQREKALLKLPDVAVEAVSRYLRVRGNGAGRLFRSVGNRGGNRDRRLETRSVLRIVRTRGAAIGIKLARHPPFGNHRSDRRRTEGRHRPRSDPPFQPAQTGRDDDALSR